MSSAAVSTERTSDASLRGFIERAQNAGRLESIATPTHWRYEIGRATREGKNALLFENIPDYSGHRVFTNGLRDLELICLALGLERDLKREELLELLRQRAASPLPSTTVEVGPVFQNEREGDAVNLLDMPIPHWNESDCERYLGTWHINVSSDPETGVRNVGCYRMQFLGPKQATVNTAPESHLARHVALAELEGRAQPVAVAIGVDEAVMMAASAGYPYGMDEYELAGALQQQPVELVQCKESALKIPANSEILIEGFIHPHVRVTDGPYFDYTGTTNTNPTAFLFETTRLAFRNNPIFRGTSIGIPGAEDHQLFAILAELRLLDFHRASVKKHIQDKMLKQRLLRWTGVTS